MHIGEDENLVDGPEWFLVPLNGTSQTIYFCKAGYFQTPQASEP